MPRQITNSRVYARRFVVFCYKLVMIMRVSLSLSFGTVGWFHSLARQTLPQQGFYYRVGQEKLIALQCEQK